MTIDRLVEETLSEWSEEAGVPPDLASRAIGRRRRARARGVVALAGVTAAVTALILTVPSLNRAEDRPPPVVTEPQPALEVRADPGSPIPKTLVAAGDVAVYTYATISVDRSLAGGRTLMRRVWYLYDPVRKKYVKTPWARVDVAAGGKYAAVLESYPARRVGVMSTTGGEVRWTALDQPAGAVNWSPDGTKLLVTAYGTDPSVFSGADADQLPPGRTGFYVVTPGQERAAFHALPGGGGALSGTVVSDLGWSSDGSLIWETGEDGVHSRRFLDLEGRPAPAPAHEEGLPDTRTMLSPDGRLLAIERSAYPDPLVVRNLADGKVIPIPSSKDHHAVSMAAWADAGHVIAWACVPTGTPACPVIDHLALIPLHGGSPIRLTGSADFPWQPTFTRR
ncbi:hypothetical protein [Streptosporangium lutulentum]|uniref:WD40-like Beta Propeller Repeat n=1 Tax=Streptosporangium lutulentum TaxID=1461250 RepID=A0ABT9QQW7_9ACTN|nr:hypothetical protein [Streptosporangium lutulentum]MDP9849127.1 hypothetical protein [Streptosporangium lutulentum]